LIAGRAEDVGLSEMQLGGVAPAHTSCEPNDSALSYTFLNHSYYFYQPNQVQARI